MQSASDTEKATLTLLGDGGRRGSDSLPLFPESAAGFSRVDLGAGKRGEALEAVGGSSSSKEADHAVTKAAAKYAEEKDPVAEEERDNVSSTISRQLLATLERMGQQKWRTKWRVLCELLVPIVFAIVLAALSIAFSTTQQEHSYVNYTFGSVYYLNPYSYYIFTCSNASMFGNQTINGIPECGQYDTSVDCSGDESELPVKGFCSRGGIDWASEVAAWSSKVVGQPIGIYNLDSVIVQQWGASKAFFGRKESLPLLSAISAMGFGTSLYTRYNSIANSGYLYFAPAANVPVGLINFFNTTSALFRYVYGGTFDTVAEAEEFVKTTEKPTWAVIVVNDIRHGFDVEIRLRGSSLPTTSKTVNTAFSGSYYFDSGDMYIASGFAHLQKVLYEYYLTMSMSNRTYVSSFTPMRSLAVAQTQGSSDSKRMMLLELASPAVGFMVVLSYLYPFSQMVKRQVLEKELRLRETMLIMGIGRVPLYLSFFIVNTLQGTFTMLLFTVVIKAGVTPESDPFCLFLIFFVFMLSTIPLAGLVSTFFSSARLASQLSPLIYFIMSLPVFALGFSSPDTTIGLSIFSPTALAELVSCYLDLESGDGFDIHSFQHAHINPRPALVMMMLVIDIAFYTVMMLYCDTVIPNRYGTPQHPLFFVIRPYHKLRKWWAARHPTSPTVTPSLMGNGEHEPTEGGGGGSTPRYNAVRNPDGVFDDDDAVVASRTKAVELLGLCKRYKRGGKTFCAVDHLTWSMNAHEISVMLGRNGAGKSTSVNMITGMTKPDEGDCRVCNYSVRTNLATVRQLLGYCPQHNTLWPDLTCREHLEFFAKSKGLRGAPLEDAVVDILDWVDLTDKANQLSRALSGGQKRKLSVAMAFVGRNRVVILDEPTAGMDAAARRHMWQLLRSMTNRCTMLLTTHYMDEADLLGDRIAIIDQGQLQCSGSGLFLKSRLGTGYTLRVDLKAGCVPPLVATALLGVLPTARVFSQNGREMQYGIPKDAIGQMPRAFRMLESRGKELGVRGFSVSASTLEEVFLSVVNQVCTAEAAAAAAAAAAAGATRGTPDARGADRVTVEQAHSPLWGREGGEDNGAAGDSAGDDDTSTLFSEAGEYASPVVSGAGVNFGARRGTIGSPNMTRRPTTMMANVAPAKLQTVWNSHYEEDSWTLWRMQLVGMIQKRFHCALRDRKLQFFQVLCPVACILIAMCLQLVKLPSSSGLEMDPKIYKSPSVLPLSVCWDQMPYLYADPSNTTIDPGVTLDFVPYRSAYQLDSYLLDTYRVHPLPRYFAAQCVDPNYLQTLEDGYKYTVETSNINEAPKISDFVDNVHVMMYNTSSSHSLGVGLHEFYNLLRVDGARRAAATYPMFSSPRAALHYPFKLAFNPLPASKTETSSSTSAALMLIAVIVVIPFTFLPSTPVSWVVKERECKARHIQRLSGLHYLAYWVGNFLFDIASYCMTVVLVVLILVIFQRKEFVGTTVIGATIVGFVTYGVCMTLYAYAFGFMFSEHTTAQQVTMLFSFFTGFILTLVIFVMQMNETTEGLSGTLRWVFRLFPCFSMGEIVLNLAVLRQRYLALGTLPWTMDTIGWPCVYMAAEVPVFVVVIFLVEHPMRQRVQHVVVAFVRRVLGALGLPCWKQYHLAEDDPLPKGSVSERLSKSKKSQKDSLWKEAEAESDGDERFTYEPIGGGAFLTPAGPKVAGLHKRTGSRGYYFHNDTKSVLAMAPSGELLRLNGEDSDVEDERQAVQYEMGMGRNNDVVRMVNLRKVYGNGKVAVRSLTFGVVPGEVFAFLGTNGAGKTTAMSILCQEQIATRGRAYVAGFDTLTESADAMRCVGYCPQFDATLDLLTVEEHLQLYAKVRGILPREQPALIECLMDVCDLLAYRKVLSRDLSGGNRRKLSVAVTLVGAPRVVCLDEPSAGMDPVSRRRLWDAIQHIAGQCSVLLTTHHLEEVEALADCVAIMSKGTLCCIGDLSHLKTKYGSGYEMSLRVSGASTGITQAPAEGPLDGFDPASPRGEEVRADPVLSFVAQNFHGALLNECFRGERYVFALPPRTVLSRVFELLQRHQADLHITDYTVSQTSIEQVFLRFCGEDEEDGGGGNGKGGEGEGPSGTCGDDGREASRGNATVTPSRGGEDGASIAFKESALRASHRAAARSAANSYLPLGPQDSLQGDGRQQAGRERWMSGVSGIRRGYT